MRGETTGHGRAERSAPSARDRDGSWLASITQGAECRLIDGDDERGAEWGGHEAQRAGALVHVGRAGDRAEAGALVGVLAFQAGLLGLEGREAVVGSGQ